jgi:hypothetical protein
MLHAPLPRPRYNAREFAFHRCAAFKIGLMRALSRQSTQPPDAT